MQAVAVYVDIMAGQIYRELPWQEGYGIVSMADELVQGVWRQ
jgi:hypothetical protein